MFPSTYDAIRNCEPGGRGISAVGIFDRNGRVSREDEVLWSILDAVNRTEAITSIARDIELFVQEYGLIAVHLRGLHRETGLVVIVKVGTSARENFWCRELHRLAPDLTPAVYAAGSRLGDIDVHWIASEAIPYGPLGNSWNGREFDLMLDAGIRFYQHANLINDPALGVTTQAEVSGWLEGAIRRQCPGPVDVLLSRVEDHWDFVFEKCGSETCFDDLHMCNGLMREPPPGGDRAVLIDVHPIRRPWILDPAYLQVLNSGDRNRPGHRDLVRRMAVKRQAAGLASLEGPDLVAATRIAQGWMAARQWRPELPDSQPGIRESFCNFIADAADV